MRLHALQGIRGKVIDLDTGREVRKVIWLDIDRGELEAYQIDAQGIEISDINGCKLTYRAKGRFAFVPKDSLDPRYTKGYEGSRDAPLFSRRLSEGAVCCAMCRSPLTLPGDDLCIRCRCSQRVQKWKPKVERLATPLLDKKCCRCTRLATWSVADEVEVSPQRYGRGLYERGATVGQRFYCSFCYKPPRLLDAKGEEIQEFDTMGLRPN